MKMSIASVDIQKGLDSIYYKVFPYISHEKYPESFEQKEEKETWREFYKIIKKLHGKYKNYIHDSYLQGLKDLNYSEFNIPTLDDLSDCLLAWGWQAVWVNGYVPASVYAALIARGYFPIARLMRRKVFLEHSPIPDFIHDVWGHLPLLCNKTYSQYIKEIATAIENAETNEFDLQLYEAQVKVAKLKHQMVLPNDTELIQAEQSLSIALSLVERSPSKQALLARVFLWSIEFGLLETPPELFKIIGAGILSAPLEFINTIEKKIKIKEYSTDIIHRSLIYFSSLQPEFFTIKHFQNWREILAELLRQSGTLI